MKPVIVMTQTSKVQSDMVEVIHKPFIKIQSLEFDTQLLHDNYDWLIFSSKNAVHLFYKYLEYVNVKHIAVVGLSEDRSQNMEYIGFINDDTNAVGKVHIGVVFKIKVKSSDVEVRETDTLKINWVSQDEINDLNHFESWSALILKDLK